MDQTPSTTEVIASKVDRVRQAHAKGDLNEYKPLLASGAEDAKATATTSWGPAMRR